MLINRFATLLCLLLFAVNSQATLELDSDSAEAKEIEKLFRDNPPDKVFEKTEVTGNINAISFSPDGKLVASGYNDGMVRLWQVSTEELVNEFRDHSKAIFSIVFSPDGRSLATSSEDGSIFLRDLSTEKVLKHLKLHTEAVYSLAFSPDGKKLASSSRDQTIKIWDISSGTVLKNITGSPASILDFSPDGKSLALGLGQNQGVGIVNPDSGQLITTLSTSSQTLALSFSPDGSFLSSSGRGQTINIWSLEDFQLTAKLRGHSDVVWWISYSPSGEFLASASADNTVRVWNTFTGEEIRTFGYKAPFFSVAFSPDGKTLLAGAGDGKLLAWDFVEAKFNLLNYLYLFLFLLGTLYFSFRFYKSESYASIKEPEHLFFLKLDDLSSVKKGLSRVGFLNRTLDQADISQSTFNRAAEFKSLAVKDKSEYIAERLNAKLSKQLSPHLFELKMPDDFPLNINRILLYFPECEAQDAIHQLKAIPQAEGRITIIIGANANYQLKLLTNTSDKTNKFVSPQSQHLTNLLLSSKPQLVLSKILAEQLSLTQLSPYEIGGGVSKASIFFGRSELISQIVNRDPANYLVVGGRQLGQSSLLKEIERRYADNPNVECHYYSLSSEALIEPLSHSLRLPKRTNNPEYFARQLEQRIGENGQRFVLLIDEADKFIEYEQANSYPVLNVLRRLSEQGQCYFILAGFWQLYQHASLDYQSPLRNFGEVIEVGSLEEEACLELARKPMQTMGLSYSNDAIVQHMVEACGQRANLIAFVCHRIVQTLPEKQRVIEAGDIRRVLDSREMKKRFDGWLIGITQREKDYMQLVIYSTVHKDSFSEGELITECKEKGIVLDNSELERTLSHLELAFILEHLDTNRWKYRVPLFVQYMQGLEVDVKLENLLISWTKS